MIAFTQIGRLGRLGNQLFQYAAGRGVATHKGLEFKIPDPKNQEWHGQQCYLDKFNLECGVLSPEDYNTLQHRYVEPDHMKCDLGVLNIPDNTDLHGFFQSTHYFQHCQNQLRRELTPKTEYVTTAATKIRELKELHPGYEIVSLHLRRGDNTDGSNKSGILNNMYGRDNKFELNSFYGEFFTRAMIHFRGQQVKYLVFTGGSRATGNPTNVDVEWCKSVFKGPQYLFSEESDSFKDFCLIRECDHNIISPISTFGWWAAYLNPNPGRQVLAPDKYDPSDQSVKHREGFYPSEWILL